MDKTIESWVVRPIYKIQKNKKKFKQVDGMIIARDEIVARRVEQEYRSRDVEVSVAFERIELNEEEL